MPQLQYIPEGSSSHDLIGIGVLRSSEGEPPRAQAREQRAGDPPIIYITRLKVLFTELCWMAGLSGAA
jgi:hypothetical protein